MKLHLVILILAIATMTSGCQFAAKISSRPVKKHQEIFSKYSHLSGARFRSGFFNTFMPNDSTVMTVGKNIYVTEKWWNETFDPSTDWYHSLMLHENEHAKRQQEIGAEVWLAKYIWSKSFRWEEEFAADIVRWRYLIVEKGYRVSDEMLQAEARWFAQNYSGMVSEEEALQRYRALVEQLQEERDTRDTSTTRSQRLFITPRERD